MTDPTLPIVFGSHILDGRIASFDNPDAAPIRVTLYHYGPPHVLAYNLYHLWPWPDVHNANLSGTPLVWF